VSSNLASVSRTQLVAEVNELLVGSYTASGIERWGKRPRTALGGQTPLVIIGDGEQIDAQAAKRVRRMAAALAGPGNFT
jgi:hypothetical protein